MMQTTSWVLAKLIMKNFARAAVALLMLMPFVAEAVPVTITGANVWRADRTPNPIGFISTALVPWVSVTTDPSGSVADTVVTASNGSSTYTLSRIPTGLLAGIYFAQIPYNPALTGPWTIAATNGANTATSTRPAFVPVDAVPFVGSIGFTGTGNDIIVNWTVTPEGVARLDEQQVAIWDLSSFPTPTTVQFFNVGAGVREIDLSALGLNIGTLYAVEINEVDRNATTGFIDAFSGNWLSGWTPTTGAVSVPEPSLLSLLSVGVGGLWFIRKRR